MPDTGWPGQVVWQQQSLTRARRFQTETALVIGLDSRKRVLKRALHTEGVAHLQRMAANHQHLRSHQPLVSACACAMNGDILEMAFIAGRNLKQQLIQAIRGNDTAGLENLLDLYRNLITAFDPPATNLTGPGSPQEIFAHNDPAAAEAVQCGNIDQGFDHLILQDNRWVLIDYEWVLGFAVPQKYVLYRAAQLFFQDVPPAVSPRFRLRDMCAFYDIDTADRALYDRMEANFQRFVRTDTGAT